MAAFDLADTETPSRPQQPPRRRSWIKRAGLDGQWLVMAALAFLGLILLVAVLGPLLQPHSHTRQDLLDQFLPPLGFGGNWSYPLGTDDLGRDILSRIIYAIRISVLIAVAGTAIGAVLGTFLGFVAARARGLVEEAIMMLVDIHLALPFVIFALAVLAFFGGNFIVLIIVVGIEGWQSYARLTRGMVLSAQQSGYVTAVRSLGFSDWHVYGRHVLPNILSALLVQLTINLPSIILLETSLSFLGIGVQPPMTSLGQMLGAGRDHLIMAWWISVIPGTIIFLFSLSACIVGDWLRDRFDPVLK